MVTNHVETAVLGCRVGFNRGGLLRRTAEGGCPHVGSDNLLG